MLSPDLAARIQTAGSTQLQPLALDKQVADKLSDFSPGQRLTAQIQAFLPNGTYRATIAQRDITLALPFSAKSGDTLELEVVESDGKLTLALLARQQGGGEKGSGTEAASTTLSRTGQLIASLFGRARGEGRGNAAALPLNGNQPIAGSPPQSAQDILPLLRQAITQSGMFYESHQAGWVAGRFEKAALMQEPQGKLSPALLAEAGKQAAGTGAGQAARANAPAMPAQAAAASEAEGRSMQPAAQAGAGSQLVAREAMPIVQQQLESLANQQFNWQGQVWPGQQMRWEIEEDGRSRQEDDDAPPGWQTRLYLALPQLGELEARIRLAGSQIHLDLDAADAATRERLHAAIGDLRKQFDDAGLTLGNVGIHILTEAAADDPEAHVAAET
ncbi:MAG: flagellar hook-length control protein FliK [Rhodocyclaceae bacterium]|nr:flagellar hook-length control protein FliK [Rhodocyclaceae bacterium]